MSQRFWTVDEANGALARVTHAVTRARSALQRGQARAVERTERAATNGHRDTNDATTALAAVVNELEADGIVVRDLDQGLVDFPAISPSGRKYWLCWVVGEPAVDWWHWPEDGFAGRTPITDPPT